MSKILGLLHSYKSAQAPFHTFCQVVSVNPFRVFSLSSKAKLSTPIINERQKKNVAEIVAIFLVITYVPSKETIQGTI